MPSVAPLRRHGRRLRATRARLARGRRGGATAGSGPRSRRSRARFARRGGRTRAAPPARTARPRPCIPASRPGHHVCAAGTARGLPHGRDRIPLADPVQRVALRRRPPGRVRRSRSGPPARASRRGRSWRIRLIDSSMSVPPRSFTPQSSASVAASRPIFTQLAWRLGIVRPSASRNAAGWRRLSSREISSIPCVRPSSVWKGMNDSGTNSVNPPVRSCSSRTTRMCSASSHGSSMWPNITVTVLRTPPRGRPR